MAPPRRPRILIVDDDGDVLNVLSRLFRARDYEVAAVSDGDEALARMRGGTPDLTLLDLGLPRMDGLLVLREIKQAASDTVVIVISGCSWHAELVLDEGARAFFPKPLDYPALEALVASCIVPF